MHIKKEYCDKSYIINMFIQLQYIHIMDLLVKYLIIGLVLR